ncbi:MAG TPA: twin-arginine translocase subunit TatC [Fimbriimonadaceae bacterium]|nr:twin-arginine translocase subunit TatC [Fimbriimonadaceae bacterium]
MSTATGLGRTRWGARRRERVAARTTTDLIGHLRELRRRMVFSLIAFILVSIAAFFFYPVLLELIRKPLCSLDSRYLGPQGCDLIFTKVGGAFMFRLKVTALAGIFLAAPVWIYQLWAFVTPGLTSKEKKYALPFLFTSAVLFMAGGVLAYLALPQGLQLLLTIGGEGLVAFLDAEKYLSFVGLMILGFGVMFEMPIFLFFLGLVGVLSSTQLRHHRRSAVVVIVALAAIVTPSQDPYTLLALSVPLYAMYEFVIIALRLVDRRRAKRELRGA